MEPPFRAPRTGVRIVILQRQLFPCATTTIALKTVMRLGERWADGVFTRPYYPQIYTSLSCRTDHSGLHWQIQPASHDVMS